MKATFRLFAAALAAAALFRAPAAEAKLPVGTPTLRGAREPVLLTEYERRVLELEYAKLVRAVREARAEAAADESLAPLKEALAEARGTGAGGTNAVAAARALADATETVLYAMDGMRDKIKRLHEVGNLLEYDHRLRREQRAAAGVGRPLPPPPPPAETEASGGGAAGAEAEAAAGAAEPDAGDARR